jgi:hypothetical protein
MGMVGGIEIVAMLIVVIYAAMVRESAALDQIFEREGAEVEQPLARR